MEPVVAVVMAIDPPLPFTASMPKLLSVIAPVMPPCWPPMVMAPPLAVALMPTPEPMLPVASMFTAPPPLVLA